MFDLIEIFSYIIYHTFIDQSIWKHLSKILRWNYFPILCLIFVGEVKESIYASFFSFPTKHNHIWSWRSEFILSCSILKPLDIISPLWWKVLQILLIRDNLIPNFWFIFFRFKCLLPCPFKAHPPGKPTIKIKHSRKSPNFLNKNYMVIPDKFIVIFWVSDLLLSNRCRIIISF